MSEHICLGGLFNWTFLLFSSLSRRLLKGISEEIASLLLLRIVLRLSHLVSSERLSCHALSCAWSHLLIMARWTRRLILLLIPDTLIWTSLHVLLLGTHHLLPLISLSLISSGSRLTTMATTRDGSHSLSLIFSSGTLSMAWRTSFVLLISSPSHLLRS